MREHHLYGKLIWSPSTGLDELTFCLWSLDPGNIESDQMRTGWAMSIIKRRLRGWKTKSERQSDEMVRRRCFRTTSVKMEQTGQNTRSSCRFLFHRSGENMSVLNIFMQSNHLNGFFSDLSQTTGSKWPSVSRVSHCFNTVNWESRLDHIKNKHTHSTVSWALETGLGSSRDEEINWEQRVKEKGSEV